MQRVRAVINGSTGGQGFSTFYFSPSQATPVQSEVDDAVARVRAFWQALAPILPTPVTVKVSQGVDLIEPTNGALVGNASAASDPAVVTGSGGASIAPPGLQVNLTMNTTFFVRGRRLRGRAYLGPLALGAIATTGVLATTSVTTVNNAALLLIANTPTTIKALVWSRPPRGGLGAAAIVQSFVVPGKLAMLRSRRD